MRDIGALATALGDPPCSFTGASCAWPQFIELSAKLQPRRGSGNGPIPKLALVGGRSPCSGQNFFWRWFGASCYTIVYRSCLDWQAQPVLRIPCKQNDSVT